MCAGRSASGAGFFVVPYAPDRFDQRGSIEPEQRRRFRAIAVRALEGDADELTLDLVEGRLQVQVLRLRLPLR